MLQVTEDYKVIQTRPIKPVTKVPSRREAQAAFDNLTKFINQKSKCKQLHGDLQILRDTLVSRDIVV